jgi:hypothetical protein
MVFDSVSVLMLKVDEMAVEGQSRVTEQEDGCWVNRY